MSDQANYPARGQMSEDGKVYTHTDGEVYNLSQDNTCCPDCFFNNIYCESLVKVSCHGGAFKRIEGAYVPSDCELEACEMARAMIKQCVSKARLVGCDNCSWVARKDCPARKYLAAHGDAQAWEVKP